MKKLLMPLILIAAAVALAACGGGGGSATASGGGGNATAMPSSGASPVSAKNISGSGMVLVDSNGQALYTPEQEASGKILCTGACNSFWMPLTAHGKVASSGSVPGKLGTVKRPDGSMQVTYNGKPLYTFSQDQPGQVTGDGFQDAFGGQQFTWHVVTAGNSGSASQSGGSTSTNAGSSGGGGGFSY
jgi:predicted lipoprotein with Yx(FWY)xxD motif